MACKLKYIVETHTYNTITIEIQIVEIHNNNFAFFIVNIEDLKISETHSIS